MRAWIARREQRRRYEGQPLGRPAQRPGATRLPAARGARPAGGPRGDRLHLVRPRPRCLPLRRRVDGHARRAGHAARPAHRDERLARALPRRARRARRRSSGCGSTRSPVLRRRLEEDNWHFLRWSNVRRLHASKRASLAALGPLLGLDPDVERGDDQMAHVQRLSRCPTQPSGGRSCLTPSRGQPGPCLRRSRLGAVPRPDPLWATCAGRRALGRPPR